MLHLDPVGSGAAPVVLPLVERYFAYDGLRYGSDVDAAVRALLEEPDLGRVFLVRIDDRIVGYCALTYGFDAEAGGRIGVVTEVFLLAEARGQGLGGQLMDGLADFARQENLRRLELVVLDSNDRARRLYQSRAFQPVRRRTTMTLDL